MGRTCAMIRRIFIASFALFSAACATSFSGDAHYPGGPSACFERCAKVNMEMSGFIYAGEFASACVCEPRGRRNRETSKAEVSALVGVMSQMRDRAMMASGAAGGAAGAAGVGALGVGR